MTIDNPSQLPPVALSQTGQPLPHPEQVVVYVKGVADDTLGKTGGYAALLCRTNPGGEHLKSPLPIGGWESGTTAPALEMQAVLRGLKALGKSASLPVILRSSLKFIVDGINGDLERWATAGRLNPGKRAVANHELWGEIWALMAQLRVSAELWKADGTDELMSKTHAEARQQADIGLRRAGATWRPR